MSKDVRLLETLHFLEEAERFYYEVYLENCEGDAVDLDTYLLHCTVTYEKRQWKAQICEGEGHKMKTKEINGRDFTACKRCGHTEDLSALNFTFNED